jgi:branched-chain amino acid transport system ATP-binding protein
MNDVSILSVEDIHVYYGSSHVLQGVTLSLQDGVAGIIGRNGMGKTTLVRAIMGLVPVKSGTIKFNNEVITNLKPYQIAGKGIGYVPQGRALFPSLTVEENLQLAAHTRNGKEWTIDRVYDLFPILKEKARQGASLLR